MSRSRDHALPLYPGRGPAATAGRDGRKRSGPTRRAVVFTKMAIFYVTAPIREIPFLGLSWSAPLFYLVALELWFRRGRRARGWARPWSRLLAVLWLGAVASMAVSVLLSKVPGFGLTRQVYFLVLLMYWMTVFLIVAYLVGTADLGSNLALVMGAGVSALALLTIGETVLGAPRSISHLSQNGLGIQLSTFGPFLFYPALTGSRRRRLLGRAGLILVLLAAALNASRGSWIALALAVLIFFAGSWRAGYRLKGTGVVLVLAVLIPMGLALLPRGATEHMLYRSASFDRLETDKPTQARLALVRKGWRIFTGNVFFGIGPLGFRHYEVDDVELPRAVSYISYARFNSMSPHNAYVQALAEGGLAFCAPFLLLLASLTFRGWRASVALARSGQPWALAGFVAFVAMSAHLFVLAGLYNTSCWVVYGFLAGAIIYARGGRAARRPRRWAWSR